MKIGILGFGNMGQAIAAGLQRNQPETELLVFDKLPEKMQEAESRFGARVSADPGAICRECSLVVIAVKPQNTDDLLAELQDHTRDATVLSIVAGRSISYFRVGLRTNRVVRCMPNLAATVGRSLVGIAIPADCGDEARSQALAVAEAVGVPLEVPEELLAAVTGISGSGIAFVFEFLHALALGGTKVGLSYDTALKAAIEVVEGGCALIRNSGGHPMSLVARVASPAGTTIAGIKALEERAFTASVMEAVERAALRASELEK